MIVGFQRFDSESSKEAFRRYMMTNGVSDVNPAHSAHTAVVKAAKPTEQFFSQTPDLTAVQKNTEA